jgi:tRNA threonylcarbamoyladenosine biosynthesis protein TsaB
LSTPRALLPKDIGAMLPPGPVAVAGSAADAVLGALDRRDPPPRRAKGPALPDAGVVAQIAEAKFTAAAPRDAAPSPLYLRAPDAKLPGERSP